jgi:hypothetical protein
MFGLRSKTFGPVLIIAYLLDFSIIFIHGLGENRDEAWTSEQTSALWPRDFLTSSIPYAHVMTWGYDADLALPRSILTHRIGVWSGDLLRDLVKNREEGNSVGSAIM